MTEDIKEKHRLICSLYDEVFGCRSCMDRGSRNIIDDIEKARRIIYHSAILSKVMIVLQAPARDQVRLSGIQFHDVHGNMGRGGQYLEKKVFNKIGYTLSPNLAKQTDLQLVYTTDSVHCFPGIRENGGDIKPNGMEVAECRHYLMREIFIIKPKVIVVFGRASADTICRIAEIPGNINLDCQVRIWNVDRNAIHIIFMPHPTSMVPRKGEIFEALSERISACINNAQVDAPERPSVAR